jgi:hypothetical protein
MTPVRRIGIDVRRPRLGVRHLLAAVQAELARRWLAAFGPGTMADLKWWTGWTMGEVKRALAQIGPAEVDLDGTAGFVLPGHLEASPAAEPWVALPPALDPTVMGGRGEDGSWETRAPRCSMAAATPVPRCGGTGGSSGGGG